MATLTPKRGYSKPDVGGDKDVWGTQLNTGTIDKLDDDVQQALDDSAAALDDAKTAMVDFMNSQEPIGTIKAFNTSGGAPPGWAECDGTNGTPDLRERTVVGVAAGSLGRQRGTKNWSQNTVLITTTSNGGHTHTLSSGSVSSHSGNTGEVALIQAHLPAIALPVNNSGTYLTSRNTGNLAFNCGGTGQNVYRDNVTNTGNMGSGAGHGHDMTHGHSLSGSTAAGGAHTHNVTQTISASHGLRYFMKHRLLTVGDIP